MDLDKLLKFESDRKDEEELYITIGSIVLNPDASLNDYVLASISVLSRLQNGPISRFFLEYVTKGVAQYNLWDTDSTGKPIFEYGHDAEQVRKQTLRAFGDLYEQYFITQDLSSSSDTSGKISITDSGLHALRNVIPEEDLSRIDGKLISTRRE
ncbi:MAG TPA: hypothetical protein VMQ58_02110 [Candidatus Saccharimonadales bacterium]|jgi:hypothetical protein|nr:hypothetical protein [Candidatus Saccharimonadales bacterium]